MRPLPVLALLGLLGCTPAAHLSAPAARTAPDWGAARSPAVSSAAADTLAAEPARVWQAALQAYQQLNIPLGTVDARERVLGNRRFLAARVLADQPMPLLLSCDASEARARAAVPIVHLSVLTRLRPTAAGGTEVRTEVDARAGQPGSTRLDRCRSTGELERQIAALIQARVGGAAALLGGAPAADLAH